MHKFKMALIRVSRIQSHIAKAWLDLPVVMFCHAFGLVDCLEHVRRQELTLAEHIQTYAMLFEQGTIPEPQLKHIYFGKMNAPFLA